MAPAQTDGIPIRLSSAPSSLSESTPTTSSFVTTTDIKQSSTPGDITGTYLSESAVQMTPSNHLHTPASESITSLAATSASTDLDSSNNPSTGTSSTPDLPSATSINVDTSIAVLTSAGLTVTYSATFISTAASVTGIQTATETDSTGVFGIIMFPGTQVRSWKFPCLVSCEEGFSMQSLGPPPGIGPLSGGFGGGGGGVGGGGGGGGAAGGGGGGGDSGGGTDKSNPGKDNKDNKNDSQSKKQSDQTKSDPTSSSATSSECITQTASSCKVICPTSASGDSSSACSTTCITNSGCSVTNTATTTTASCINSFECLTACSTTLGGPPVGCSTYCTDRGSSSSSTNMPPATRTATADSEATLWTITIVTNLFVHPAYTFDSALAYAAMQSIHNDQTTVRPSGLTTRVSTSSAVSTSSMPSSALESSSVPSSKLSSVRQETSISSSTLPPAPASKQSSLNSPPPFSTPPTSESAVSPSPTPTKIPTTTSAPPPHDTAATYIDCSPIGCVGIARDDAIKSIKSFCKSPTTLNSATPTAIQSFDFEGSKVRPTPITGSFPELLVIAIELDTDPRCAEAKYSVSPPRGYDKSIVSGPEGKCVKMLQSTLDSCNVDTVLNKLGGTVTKNCFAWSIFTGNAHGNC
ncbi:hypothetical protein ONS96_006777 [Cadophora gregata f. sp. sojae]|nr:hypothetical protein ONS96_006777 [Cadophora gregata f. sp. sojae]